jgi:hypothetical protein
MPTTMTIAATGAIQRKHSPAWLGIPTFGSNFWYPHWKQNSNYVFDSRDSGQNFVLNSAVEQSTNQNSDSKIWNSKKKIGSQYISFCTRKMVAAIPISTQNGCRHTYIYSKWLLTYLHLLKTVATIPTSTQNGCHHTYIYSKQLPPYLHLLKMVATIPTSNQNGCRHTFIYSKWLPPYLHLLKKKAGSFSDS